MPLRDEVMEYLARIDGGYAWWGGVNGSPDINFVWGGDYYGFYVRPAGRRINHSQRPVKQALTDACGVVMSVHSLTAVEQVLGRDERRYRLHRALPLSQMRNLLKDWGKGDHRLGWIGAFVRDLPDNEQRMILARYVDRLSVDEIAREYEYTEIYVYRLLKNAQERIIEWALEGRKAGRGD